MKKLMVAAAPLLVAVSGFAHADESYPKLSGELVMELQSDITHNSDDSAAELTDTYPTVTLGAGLAFTKEFSVNLEATLEPVEDASDDRFFEDLGAYINVLTVNYDTDDFSLYVGKFTPNFGLAWDAAPGLYGTDLNGDYELAEMLGFGGSFNFKAAGEHSVSSSLFFVDTTFLSDSAGNSRGPIEESDGGAGNTESLSSFAVALDGTLEPLGGLQYHVGFSSLAEGDDGDEAQRGYVFGLQHEFELGEDVSLTPLAEYAYLDNFGGIDGDSAQFMTAGVALGVGPWTLSTTYQDRDTEVGSDKFDDYVADVTVGYAFEFGLEVAAGYRIGEEEGTDSQGFGVFAGYAIEF